MLLTLLDGSTVFVRPISPEDKPLLAAGLRQISPETAFRRFLSPKVSFSAAELRYLTEVDQRSHIGLGRQLVALVAERAREQGITHIAGTMLAGNAPALKLMRGFGTQVDRDVISHGVREVVTRLAA